MERTRQRFAAALCAILMIQGVMSLMADKTGTKAKQDFTIAVKGAAGNGRKDDTAAFQKALNQAGARGGGTVFAGPGTYLIRGSLSVPAGVTLQGSWQAPHHEDITWGTALFATGGRDEKTTDALIELQPSSCVRGLTIYYPEQKLQDVHSYPYSIRGRGMHCNVLDVTLVNSYRGIDFGTYANELHHVRNVFGCVLREGIFVDKCTDIGRIENVHINPHYWCRAKTPGGEPVDGGKLIQYMNDNLEAFVFGRTDWEYVLNTFAFAFKTCYKFIQTKDGACNGNFLGIGADYGQTCVLAEATQPMGVQITNGEFTSVAGEDPTFVETAKSFEGVLQFTNCAFWGNARHIAKLKGPGHLNLNQCNFIGCGKGEANDPLVEVTSGTLQVSASRFATWRHNYFRFGPDAKSAVITGNYFRGKLEPENQGKAKLEIGLNMIDEVTTPTRRHRH